MICLWEYAILVAGVQVDVLGILASHCYDRLTVIDTALEIPDNLARVCDLAIEMCVFHAYFDAEFRKFFDWGR